MIEQLESAPEFVPHPNETIEIAYRTVEHQLMANNLLSREQIGALIPSVQYGDLSTHPVKAEYGLEHVVAIVENGGHITVGEKFVQASAEKQRHILCHEIGHRLHDIIQQGLSWYPDILALIESLPPAEISLYVSSLSRKMPEGPKRREKLLDEAVAELFAQYLAGGGSFVGMLQEKMLLTPAEQTVQGSESFRLSTATVDELEGFDQWTEAEQEEYLAHRPDLTPHFLLYQNLDAIMSDSDWLDGELATIDAEWEDVDEDESIFEMPMLPASTLAALPPASPQTPGRGGFFELFRLLALMPRNGASPER